MLRPVLAGRLQYESLKSGLVDLADIDRLNEVLDVEAYNQHVYRELMRNQHVRR